jgi:DNA-directed RNA polymerase specialized sigma24 family protein
MVGEDKVLMSMKELRRLHVIRHAMEKKLTQKKAGALMGLTARHVRRLIQRVRQEGDRGPGQAVEPTDRGAGQGEGAPAV